MVKPQSPYAKRALMMVKTWGKKNRVKVFPDASSAKVLNNSTKGFKGDALFKAIDALVVLGGDGTFLTGAREAMHHSIPLLGINLGSLGFMTEVALDELDVALDQLAMGNFVVEERILLDLETGQGKKKRNEVALNEVVFSRQSVAKMVELSVSINNQYVTHFRADGLIISTPTGSTAYALSSGGPILYPTMDAIVVCPISPHTLSNRPVVIPGDGVIKITIMKGQKDVSATLDGHIRVGLSPKDSITLRRSGKSVSIIRTPGRTHFDTLRNKLGWGGSATTRRERNG